MPEAVCAASAIFGAFAQDLDFFEQVFVFDSRFSDSFFRFAASLLVSVSGRLAGVFVYAAFLDDDLEAVFLLDLLFLLFRRSFRFFRIFFYFRLCRLFRLGRLDLFDPYLRQSGADSEESLGRLLQYGHRYLFSRELQVGQGEIDSAVDGVTPFFRISHA